VLTVPAGLNLTGQVEVSVQWDAGSSRPTRATQNYNNATGIRSLFLVPAGDGRARPVSSVVSLREIGVEGAYTAVRSTVTIEPLYDVHVSALTFTLRDDCDFVGESEVVIRWASADDGQGEYEASMEKGFVRTAAAFERTYQEVGQSANLYEPVVEFYEDDFTGGSDFHRYPASGPPLELGRDRPIDHLERATNDVDCTARIQYSITFQLREYLYLDS
jgi:hypothetical protein